MWCLALQVFIWSCQLSVGNVKTFLSVGMCVLLLTRLEEVLISCVSLFIMDFFSKLEPDTVLVGHWVKEMFTLHSCAEGDRMVLQ